MGEAASALRARRAGPRPAAPRLSAGTRRPLDRPAACRPLSPFAPPVRVSPHAAQHLSGGHRSTPQVDNRTSSASLSGVEASLTKVLHFFTPSGQLAFTASEPTSKAALPLPPGGLPPGASHAFGGAVLPLNPGAAPTAVGRVRSEGRAGRRARLAGGRPVRRACCGQGGSAMYCRTAHIRHSAIGTRLPTQIPSPSLSPAGVLCMRQLSPQPPTTGRHPTHLNGPL
jgi:hypothetical protein